MVDSIITYLTKHSDEILLTIGTALFLTALAFWYKKIKYWSGLAWKKIKRFFLNARPKVYRAIGVAPVEDVQTLGAEIRSTGSVSPAVSPTAVPPYEMKFQDNVYWKRSGDIKDGPYCPKCYDGDRKEVRLTEYVDDRFWRCPVCDTAVEKPGRGSRPTRADTEFDPFSG